MKSKDELREIMARLLQHHKNQFGTDALESELRAILIERLAKHRKEVLEASLQFGVEDCLRSLEVLDEGLDKCEPEPEPVKEEPKDEPKPKKTKAKSKGKRKSRAKSKVRSK